MRSSIATLLTVALICIIQAEISSSIEVTISPTCSGRHSACRTLSTIPLGTNITLFFSPGVHIVPSSTSYSSSPSFSLERKQYLELKGNSQAAITCTPARYGPNIRISYTSNVKISGLTLIGCNIEFSRVNNTAISNSNFIDGSNGALEFSYSNNITIDETKFHNNSDSSFGGVIEFSYTKGIEITRSNFSNNRVSSFAGVIEFSSSAGFIGCSNFMNNTASSFGGLITTKSGSTIYISNSTFNNSTTSSFSGVIRCDSTNDNVIIVSSVFTNNKVSSFGGVIKIDSSKAHASIISSKFINTKTSRRYSSIGPSLYSDSRDVLIDCSEFENSTIPVQYVLYNSGLCSTYNLDDSTTCVDTDCNLKDCRPSEVKISLEQSEYTVNEGMEKSARALQICAVATDLQFGVQASLQIQNDSATETEDFITGSPECRLFKFNRRLGIQKKCAFIRIVEDSIKEGPEQFSVSLSSFNPQVVFDIQKATITIVDGNTELADSTSTAEKSSDTPTTTPIPVTNKPGPLKVAIVECGPLRRPITYSSGGNDLENLKTAIVQSFRGLTGIASGHIALLQIKSDKYADYIDAQDSSAVMSDNILVRVITYESFSCQPRYVPN